MATDDIGRFKANGKGRSTDEIGRFNRPAGQRAIFSDDMAEACKAKRHVHIEDFKEPPRNHPLRFSDDMGSYKRSGDGFSILIFKALKRFAKGNGIFCSFEIQQKPIELMKRKSKKLLDSNDDPKAENYCSLSKNVVSVNDIKPIEMSVLRELHPVNGALDLPPLPLRILRTTGYELRLD
ncbi:MAG: hypothetical protein IAF58_15020 [Leptolyngbya sp.]|nr:hypothetical protein [Candidatus Melainabacteria bacterium]